MYTTCNLKSTLYKRRTRKDVHPIDTTVCAGVDGYDDLDKNLWEEGAWSEATTIKSGDLCPEVLHIRTKNYLQLGFFRLALPDFVPEGFWVKQLPIDHDFQDTQKIKTILRYKNSRSMSDELYKAINDSEYFGEDPDLLDGTDPLLQDVSLSYWLYGPDTAPRSDYF